VPISHCLALFPLIYLLGHDSEGLHLYFVDYTKWIVAVQPEALHFLLPFAMLSDIGWCRLRFDLDYTHSQYPCVIFIFRCPHSVAFITQDNSRYIYAISRGWRDILIDYAFDAFFDFFQR
jgi:hypothetical protein